MNYKPVIGLEIHVELKTKSKMFCGCDADYFGKEANTNTCPVCLGLPGAMPVPNKKAVEWAILIGKALNCKINSISKFDRKHYFYPDLSKGFQISQYDQPIAINGKLRISNFQFLDKSQIINHKLAKTFGITRVHLEEDTGKLIHSGDDTLVDFNRSGVPLVEIVTEPDFDNAEDVKIFLEELHTIIRYLGVSDADMEKGSMRMEPNVSVMSYELGVKRKKELPNYKVEVKNINSFNFVKKAIEYEIERHTDLLQKGKTPAQETRGFDSKKGVTYAQRSKEEAHDYRYFPEPDIPPLNFSQEYIDSIRVPDLPQSKMDSYLKLGLKPQDAFILTRDKKDSERFAKTILKIKVEDRIKAVDVANVIINLKETKNLTEVELYNKVIELRKPKQTDEKALNASIKRLIEVNKKAVDDYKKGKENSIMFLVGAVMRDMQGKADALTIKKKLIEILKTR